MGIFKAVGFEPWTVKKTTLPTLHNDCIGFEIYDINFLKLILAKKTFQIFAKNIFFFFKKYSFHSKKDERWQKTFLFWKFAICCKSTTGSSPVLPFSDLKHSASMVFSHRKYSFSTVVVEPRVGLKWNFLLMFCRSITFVVTSFVEASPMSSDVLQHWSHWPLADSSPDESFSNHIFESF